VYRLPRRALSFVLVLLSGWAACSDDKTGHVPDPALSVQLVCAPDQCDVAGVCRDHLEVNPGNPCEACVVLIDRSRFSAWDAAGICDDGNACTTGDACQLGRCTGIPFACDDGDPCTSDRCDGATGACAADPDVAKCGADPCLVLAPGALEGEAPAAPDCDDDDPCTDDRCEPWVGCVHDPVAPDAGLAVACDDGDVCTRDDACRDGMCEGKVAIDCDDDDLCTIDVCEPAVSPAAAVPGEPATADTGGCRNTSIARLCEDDNPCTDARCDPERGCVYPFNSDPCDDRNACTARDTCSGGACLGTVVSPDDQNPCSDDACDPALGVINLPNRLPCTDGNACTLGDVCADAACVPGPTPLACDDLNGCSDDACLPASGCAFTDHDRPCSDASRCTAGDVCQGGACVGAVVDCDDDNACTTDACAPATGCAHQLIVSDPCRPTIVVTYPPRGATLTEAASQTITVSGQVDSGAGPITSLRINNVVTAVAANGTFSRAITPTHGGNILVITAADSFGSTRKLVQSFLWSRAYRQPTTPKSGIVSDGVGIWLDKVAIDDGSRASPPNDLASILQIALRTFDIAGLIPRPAANNLNAGSVVGIYDIYVNNLTYSPPTAQLWPQAGGIHMRGRISNGRADIRASKQCSAGFFDCWGPGTITGTMTFTSIVIDVDLDLSVVNNDIRVTVRSSTVVINGVDIQIDGAFGWLVEFIIGFFEDDLVATIEDQFNAQLAPVIGPLVRDGLRALAFQVGLDIPKVQGGGTIPVDLVTDWRSVSCDAEGCRIVLRAGAYTDPKRTPYTNSGIPHRDACGNGTQGLTIPMAKILELSLSDDTLNQLLFALWRGGLLEFPVPAAWLQGVDVAQYGITNLTLTLSGMLAPTASDCGGSGLDAHVGDVKISARMKLFGQNVDVVVWASIVAGLQLYLDGRDIGIRMTGIERAETEVTVVQPNLISLEPVITNLIEDQVLDGLVAALGGGQLGSFPLPDIDLSGAIAGLPAGTGITIVPETITRAGGNTIAGGRLD